MIEWNKLVLAFEENLDKPISVHQGPQLGTKDRGNAILQAVSRVDPVVTTVFDHPVRLTGRDGRACLLNPVPINPEGCAGHLLYGTCGMRLQGPKRHPHCEKLANRDHYGGLKSLTGYWKAAVNQSTDFDIQFGENQYPWGV